MHWVYILLIMHWHACMSTQFSKTWRSIVYARTQHYASLMRNTFPDHWLHWVCLADPRAISTHHHGEDRRVRSVLTTTWVNFLHHNRSQPCQHSRILKCFLTCWNIVGDDGFPFWFPRDFMHVRRVQLDGELHAFPYHDILILCPKGVANQL